jgi:hypothetical protein
MLGHSILHDLLDEFGESSDVQDAAGILYTGKFIHVLYSLPLLIALIASSDTVRLLHLIAITH